MLSELKKPKTCSCGKKYKTINSKQKLGIAEGLYWFNCPKCKSTLATKLTNIGRVG